MSGNLLRYPHPGARFQQHKTDGVELVRIQKIGYAARENESNLPVPQSSVPLF